MLIEIFEQVDELTGNNQTDVQGFNWDNVRSAIHAIITKSMDIDARESFFYLKVGSYMIMNNVEYIARNYKHWKFNKPNNVPHYLDW
tara:strand:+ start:132 stop:392 length:261 start_codon:yes stop_codon:yes gene_type:complete